MQDLRDKLLKAGLVNKKAKKQADHQARVERTKQRKKGVDAKRVQADKDRRFAEQLERQRRQDREREKARQAEIERRTAEQRAAQSLEHAEQRRLVEIDRARELVQASMFLPENPGPVRFHFVSRSGGIRFLALSTGLACELDRGRLAIAELPGCQRWGLIHSDVAERVKRVEPALVRFFTAETEGELAPEPEIVTHVPERRRLRVPRRFELEGKPRLKADRADR